MIADLQHVTLVLVLLEPLQGGVAQRLVGLRRDDHGLKVVLLEAGVVGAGIELALLPAAPDAFVYHLADPQQRDLHQHSRDLDFPPFGSMRTPATEHS